MLIFLALFLIIIAVVGIVLKWHWIPQGRRQAAATRERQRLALELSQPYQQKLAADRAHFLALEKLNQEKAHFNHQVTTDIAKLWLEQHYLPAERYIVNASVESILALPSLKRETQPGQPAQPPIITEVPAPYDLLQELAGWRPSPSGIFLARSVQEKMLVSMDRLWHIALTGPTGGGKTNILRGILAQLLYLNAVCYLCDIHYAPLKKGMDWRPIASRLALPPVRDVGDTYALVEQLARGELQNRINREHDGKPIGPPTYIAIEELPAVVDEKPEIMPLLGKLLRQGRQYDLCFIGATQDMLVKTLGTSSGVRECFRTGFYTGGDQTTARIILDLQKGQSINEEGLGDQGHVYLKTALSVAREVRVPFASNEAITALLPPAEPPAAGIVESSSTPGLHPVHRRFGKRLEPALQAKVEPVMHKQALGVTNRGDIIAEVWGIKQSRGEKYQQACEEYAQVMKYIVDLAQFSQEGEP